MSIHVILGDVHLGKSISIGKPGSGSNLNSRIQDQLNLLDWTLAQAKRHEAQSIILTGDIYEEPRPHPALINYFMTWLKSCERANIKIDIIAGNHDILRTGNYTVSALDIVPAVELPQANVHKNVTTLHHDGVSFTLVPYRDRRMYDKESNIDAMRILNEEFKDEYKSIPKENVKVLVGHLAFEGSIWIGDEVDDMANELFCPAAMFQKWDYVWMGHIHKPQTLKSPANTHMAHVGSMDRSDFSKAETDHEKIIIVFNSEAKDKYKEIIIPTRTLKKLDVKVPFGEETTSYIISEIDKKHKEESLLDSILKIEVELEGQESENAERSKIKNYLYNELGVHHIAHFSESRNISVVPIEKQNLFDSNMSVPATVRAYADSDYLQVKTDAERSQFVNFALECHDDFERVKESKK